MQGLQFNIQIFLTCSACLFIDEELDVPYKKVSIVGEKVIPVRYRRYILL